jgi:alpha-glucosidase
MSHMGNESALSNDANWWRQATIYQIYPRSFADVNGDGLGDIKGITSRVDYLHKLGIDAVWLSPFYPSPLADGGYDVSDYRNVDPRLGTLEDFDEMLQTLHAVGIRVFVDIVPNHSSDQHPWFQEAIRAGKGSPERDRYIFRDGQGANGELPPNDWVSHFGPQGWTRITEPDGTPGQWYLHLFAPEQPDFNWDNQDVFDDFITTLRFWADRGVDGYRVDVAHGLKKDMSEPYPSIKSFEYSVEGEEKLRTLFDRDEVHEVYRQWRKVFDEYNPPRVAIAEANAPLYRRPLYASPDELGQAINFDILHQPWRAPRFKKSISNALKLANKAGSSSTWVLSSHDEVRHASRYALPEGTDYQKWLMTDGTSPKPNAKRGLDRARAATMLLLALPGCHYIYQGEELGLPEVTDIHEPDLQDPIWIRDLKTRKGRDGCRVPLPWTKEGPSFGFGSNGSHLPQPAWWGKFSVEAEDGVEGSTLELYRAAIAARKKLQADEKLEWVDSPKKTLHFKRPNGWHSFTNFSGDKVRLPKGKVVLSSRPLKNGFVPKNTTVWFTK